MRLTGAGEMFKTILVPASGSGTDKAVFATALGLGRPFDAHLQFLHVRLTASRRCACSPSIRLLQGGGGDLP